MFVLISSSKTMRAVAKHATLRKNGNSSSGVKTIRQIKSTYNEELTFPPFASEARQIVRQLAAYSADELSGMLRLTPRMAEDAHMRLAYASSPHTEPLAALYAYNGVVFRYMDILHFSEADWQYAAQHLGIASSCYGLLRPADAIKPYRLEYDVELPAIGCSMGAFWRDKLTDYLINRVRQSGGILVDLAAHDVRQSLHWDKVCREVQVITPDFKLSQDGSLRTVIVYLKQARGVMARHIIKERIDAPEVLKTLTVNGFEYSPELSDCSNYVFTMQV